MADMQEPEIYEVSVVDDKGNTIVAYAKPENLRGYMAMMSSEYGNAKKQGMMMADLPEDVRATFEGQTAE